MSWDTHRTLDTACHEAVPIISFTTTSRGLHVLQNSYDLTSSPQDTDYDRTGSEVEEGEDAASELLAQVGCAAVPRYAQRQGAA